MSDEAEWVFELTEDVLGLGRRGDRIVVSNNGEWSQALVHRMPFNPGRLLFFAEGGQLTALSPDGHAALIRLASQPPPPEKPAVSPRRRWRRA